MTKSEQIRASLRRLLPIIWLLVSALAALAAAPAGLSTKFQPPQIPSEAPEDSKALSPAESLGRFKVAEDLELDQVLAEPIVAQPLFLNFDERGRMWVVQYRQYPAPAGLTLVSHDSFWRAVYDKVPPPPPHHFKGLDRITIHEDTHGDGIFDKHKTFVDGLSIVTAVERGRGGVWVLNPPYLLFYPDANDDDVPDGDPVVHLAGFGLEDTHSVANSLRWGPDGWLYGAQGSTVTAHIMRPGLDKEPFIHTMGQLIWRYHPKTRRFEVFAEGGGNAFGVELDDKGRIFSGHNGGDTRGFYYEQGAYLQKGFEKHGPLSNPFAFGYFPMMPNNNAPRFTHNFIIYDGGSFPEQYRGKLFGVEPLQGRVIWSDIRPDQSSFRTRDLGLVLTSEDRWFRPVDIKVGPDGAIYICDFYEQQVSHTKSRETKTDTSTGRIYRLKAKGAKPGRPFDLRKLSSAQLVEMLGHTNKWFRQTALRLLADRKDKTILPLLTKRIERGTNQPALEELWAISAAGGLTQTVALKTLSHPDPFVRLWTARLLCDENSVSPAVADKLARLARTEENLEVRNQLACSARRLPARECLAIVRGLFEHDEDARDNRMPLLVWWAIESKADADRAAVLKLFGESPLWSRPLVHEHILERLVRRYAQAGTRNDLLTCARLFELAPAPEQSRRLMAGFETAFTGRALIGLPDELVAAMARHGAAPLTLRLRQNEPEAVQTALELIANEKAPASERRQCVGIVGEMKLQTALPTLLRSVEGARDAELRRAALNALQGFENAKIAERVLGVYGSFDPASLLAAQTLLASRPAWALQWVKAVQAGVIKPETVPLNLVRKIESYKDDSLAQAARAIWGGAGAPTSAEMERQIARLAAVVRDGAGDPYNGRTLFSNTCASCHTLFGLGGQVGPDLTSYQRADLGNLLLQIVNPSAQIREGYENFTVETQDGRSLTGFVADKDNQIVLLRGLDGQNTAIPRKDIVEMKASGLSLMPEGLLEPLSEQQVRDLFAYLRSSQPLVGKPPAK
jgi:putative heme-binding domain-containing protein